ncbi:MAG: MATE family efflux transporter [Lachnospiraceae bacterium]|jgi:putative MATE family efflux protein|nr:MATE family efflux transporter [Lachnospiraceae bacterium]
MTKDMTTGNPWKIILFFSLPVLLGNLFQQFYNMADAVIVGQFLGEDALAAVGSTGSIMFLVLGFAMGIAQGFGVLISHAFGAKDEARLKHYVAVSLLLGLAVSLLTTALTITESRNLLLFMKTPENILGMANDYITIIYAGITATMAFNITSSILRGVGDSKTPLYFLLLSSALNIFLDLFFILALHSGPEGAAYATVVAQGISALLCFFYMFRKFDLLKLRRQDFYFDWKSIRELLSVGIPMSINYSVTAVGVMLLQGAVNVFGSSVVAAFTAASKVESLATQTMPTLGTTMSTYCGQNLGAKEYKRIFDGMKKAFLLVLAISLFGAVVTVGFGRYIVCLFLSNPSDTVLEYTTSYLNTISWFFVPLAMIFLYRSSLQGLGENFVPVMSGVLELIFRFLVIFFCLEPFGYAAVRYANPAAWAGAGIPLLATYLLWKRKAKRLDSA